MSGYAPVSPPDPSDRDMEDVKDMTDVKLAKAVPAEQEGAAPSVESRPAPITSFPHILALCAFNFPYGCLVSTMALVILPKEAGALYPSDESVALGVFLGLVGVSQLVCPYAGLRSDVCQSRLGKRRPFMLVGTFCCLVLFGVMYLASTKRWSTAYAACLFFGMLMLNVVYSAQTGLVPDLVADDLHGTASGITAVLQLAGSVVGFASVYLTAKLDFRLYYIVHSVVLALGTGISCFAATERRLEGPVEPLTCTKVVGAYRINTKGKGPDDEAKNDFLWVFVGRTAFYIAVSVQAFMEYFLRDVIGTESDDERRRQLAILVVVAQTNAAMVAFWSGSLSDRPDIGRKCLVYCACMVMCCVYVGFLLAPKLVAEGDAIYVIYALSAVYGVGNGCFLSVDYALALDTLPDKSTAATDLGVWGVAAFVGSAAGPLMWGSVLELSSISEQPEGSHSALSYPYKGYCGILTGGCFAAFAAGGFIWFIKGVR